MKEKEVKLHTHLLEFISGLNEKERDKYVRQSPNRFIKFLVDLCFNTLLGNIELDSKILLKLQPQRKLIEAVCGKNISLKDRRKILQKKGFFSKVILPIIPSLVKRCNSVDKCI